MWKAVLRTRWRHAPGPSFPYAMTMLAFLLLAIATSTHAVTHDEAFVPLGQMHHTALSARDGVPPDTWAMAQDRDGYLWLGGPTGLARFDGVHFDRSLNRLLPYRQVMTLRAEPNGDLWIGDRYGAVTLVHDGEITVYKDNGLPRGTIFPFVRTPDGVLWSATPNALTRFVDGKWETIRDKAGFTGHSIEQLFLGVSGTLWAIAREGAFQLRPGATSFVLAGKDDARADMVGIAGASWRPDDLSGDEVRDASGAFWIPTTSGLVRLRWQAGDVPGKPPATTERFTGKDGLSGAQALTAFRDREGNIWIATVTGLDQFRRTKLTPVVPPQPLYAPAIVPDPKGGLWIGSTTQNPLLLNEGIVSRPDMGTFVSAAASGRDGTVYLAGNAGLRANRDGVTSTVALPPELADAGLRFQGLTESPDGSIWLAGQGFHRLKDGRWTDAVGIWGVPKGYPTRMLTAADGTMWWGYRDNSVARIQGEAARLYGPDNGLSIGSTLGMYSRADRLWLSGDQGLNLLVGDKAMAIVGTGDEKFVNVSGIVELANGDLWLNSIDGLYRVTASEIAKAKVDPGHRVAFEKFDQEDGLLGPTDSLRPGPTLVEGSDGRLWIATGLGVSWVDPLTISRNPVAPVVAIESLNRTPVDPHDSARQLASGTTNVDVAFTAPTLTIPARARFRYRLVGVDKDWVDAGTRREAHYANLGPGNYRFEAIAANEDGVWSKSAATLSFGILPTFLQTGWFKALCAFAVLALVWLAYMRRLAYVTAQLRARLSERECIARDLHDTLLQSMQALLLHIESAAARVSEPDVRKALSAAADATQAAIVEGRDKVRYLRIEAPDAEEAGRTSYSLADVLKNAASSTPVQIEGKEVELALEAALELQAITREMVSNAKRHARATSIVIRARFTPGILTIGVYDNGIGVDDDVAHALGRPGHWGIPGMRERAERIGGTLTLRRLSEGGTAAEVTLPGRRAYRRRRWSWLRR
ncbi:histidine kinase [Luteibacter rhizovicinus]|uniref:Histidine kinase n=1 Tax=Luteibacter rhizovicinus TaxID=242606 RepID=A0A4R3YR22_9GAMM|nr:sensor histidine kinase [Luteibacter rhizovicinus]TCV93423.1 histidine kinase [Luteibacter rhizovicinus]